MVSICGCRNMKDKGLNAFSRYLADKNRLESSIILHMLILMLQDLCVDVLLKEAQQELTIRGCPCTVILAEDLMEFTVPRPSSKQYL